MSINVTPIPRLIDLAAPAFTLGTANAAGSAETAVASNSTLLAFDTTLPAAVSTSGSVGSATVAPRRDHVHAGGAAPVFGRVVRTAGSITTTSTSLVDVTGATLTFTTGAFPVGYSAAGCGSNDTTNSQLRLNVMIDSTLLHGTSGIVSDAQPGGKQQNISFSGQTAALSAAEHTIKMQWAVTGDTGTIKAESDINFMWSAFEIR